MKSMYNFLSRSGPEPADCGHMHVRASVGLARFSIRESVDSLCRDGTDTPIV